MELSISASVSTVSTVSSDGSKSQSSLTVYGESDEFQDLFCEVIGVLVCVRGKSSPIVSPCVS